MADFDFNIDNELAGIRTRPGGGAAKPVSQPAPPPSEQRKAPKAIEPEALPEAPAPEIKQPEPEGFGISQGHQESNAGGKQVRKMTAAVNWKGFKVLKGIFEFVGGERPVLMKHPIRRVQATGMPEPLILAVQEQLREKYKGETVDFPWGSYEIGNHNSVFTTRSTLLRYLMFDGLRDENGTHVQYAKQWLVSHQPTVFDANFSMDSLRGAADELDIFAVLLVAHLSETDADVKAPKGEQQTAETLDLISDNLMMVLRKMADQETAFETFTERNDTFQTVTLLDRMGLLKGGLPKDIHAFVRVLEQNRGDIAVMTETVDRHMVAENERKRTMAREEKLRAYARR